MVKKTVILLIIFSLTMAGRFFAQEEAYDAEKEIKTLREIQEKLRSMPDLVPPDSIYITTELKAIYYRTTQQNAQIIDLLKQLRGLLEIEKKESEEEKDLLKQIHGLLEKQLEILKEGSSLNPPTSDNKLQ